MDAGPEAGLGNRDNHVFCRQRNAACQKHFRVIHAIEYTDGYDGVEAAVGFVRKEIRLHNRYIGRACALDPLVQNARHARRSLECRDALHAAGNIESIEAGASADFENLIRSIKVFRECSKESLLLLMPDAADYRQPQHVLVEPWEAAFEEQVIHGARRAIQFQRQFYMMMRCQALHGISCFSGEHERVHSPEGLQRDKIKDAIH